MQSPELGHGSGLELIAIPGFFFVYENFDTAVLRLGQSLGLGQSLIIGWLPGL